MQRIEIKDTRPEAEKAKGQAKRAANQAYQDFDTTLIDLTDNWSGLNQQQKQETLRRGLVLVMKLVKWMLVKND